MGGGGQRNYSTTLDSKALVRYSVEVCLIATLRIQSRWPSYPKKSAHGSGGIFQYLKYQYNSPDAQSLGSAHELRKYFE